MTFNLIILVLTAVFCIPCLWVTDAPPTPPSAAAAEDSTPVIEGMKTLFSNKQYVILFCIVGGLLGMFNTFITLISQYITPYGYSEGDGGTLGAITVVVGLVSAGIIGPYLDKTKRHELLLKLCCALEVAGAVLFLLGCRANGFPLMVAGSVFFGIGGFPVIPMAMELGVEATYPIQEGTSGGFLIFAGQVGAILFLFISNALQSPDGQMVNAVILLVAVASVSFLISLLFKNEKKRIARDYNVNEEVMLPSLSSQ
ncbi:Major facilitator super domain-containing protein 7 [Kappamyces sp. JEL0680]|nr:Major facilitator super domain-containing protein 7 [Kappamyces sp. JEL0680]